jgi:benzoyl-CoA reductase subunit A
VKIYTGVDLGSTTTKAVVLTGEDEILGRGITNSRSNYDVACALARGEALTTARFALLRRRIEAEPVLSGRAADLVPELELRFRLEQHERQLEALHGVCVTSCGTADDLRALLEDVFAGMRELAAAHFTSMAAVRARSDFFRDLASSQYLKIAETVARGARSGFDRLMGVFDKSILQVENPPPDLSFESNIRAALRRAFEAGAVTGEAAAAALRDAVEQVAATPLEEDGSVGTGYGRARLPFPKESIRSEILCHGLGAHYFFPDTATVLDIGGQDTKAIQIDAEGIVTSFQMNDRCAAGCGRYLGYIADEMNLGLHELGPLAQQSCRPAKIASTCTVFAGAELRDKLSLGEKREDILAGLHRGIILRAMSLLARSGGVKEQFTFTGGVARNPAALDALRRLVEENFGERTINVSADSIYTGAVGAALFARRAKGAATVPTVGEVPSC